MIPATPKAGIPRLHSEDSGVYDDEEIDGDDDDGFYDETRAEPGEDVYDQLDVHDEQVLSSRAKVAITPWIHGVMATLASVR